MFLSRGFRTRWGPWNPLKFIDFTGPAFLINNFSLFQKFCYNCLFIYFIIYWSILTYRTCDDVYRKTLKYISYFEVVHSIETLLTYSDVYSVYFEIYFLLWSCVFYRNTFNLFRCLQCIFWKSLIPICLDVLIVGQSLDKMCTGNSSRPVWECYGFEKIHSLSAEIRKF